MSSRTIEYAIAALYEDAEKNSSYLLQAFGHPSHYLPTEYPFTILGGWSESLSNLQPYLVLCPEAEFLDVIGTKVFIVFFLV